MTRERKRCTLTLSQTATAQLAQVGNASGYVDSLVVQHAREWTEALAVLRDHGWRSAALMAACEALDGHGLTTVSRAPHILADTLDHLGQSPFAAHGVSARERSARLKQLREIPILAHALATLAREFALDNAACERAIQSASEEQ